jgi:hypothetical protein
VESAAGPRSGIDRTTGGDLPAIILHVGVEDDGVRRFSLKLDLKRVDRSPYMRPLSGAILR